MFEVLVYVYENYWRGDACPAPEQLGRKLSAQGFDAQDGDMVAGLKWVSSIQGPIGTGASFSRADLASGPHTITASVKDSDGLLGTASITLTIAAC